MEEQLNRKKLWNKRGTIPKIELDYIINLKSSDIAFTFEKPFEEYSHCKRYLSILQSIAIEFEKANDKLIDIDMECDPELYELQEIASETLVELYYKVKEESYSYLGNLDIYKDIPRMSSRDGWIVYIR